MLRSLTNHSSSFISEIFPIELCGRRRRQCGRVSLIQQGERL